MGSFDERVECPYSSLFGIYVRGALMPCLALSFGCTLWSKRVPELLPSAQVSRARVWVLYVCGGVWSRPRASSARA
jgi:hypothetical protein